MVERVYLRVLFVVLMASTLHAGVFDGAFDMASDTVCALMSTKDFENCGNDFANEIQSVDNQLFDELKSRKLCCAFNHLRDCLIGAIGDKCESHRDSVVDRVISTFVSAAKLATTHDCHTYTGRTGTVLCLNDYLLILIFVGLVVLFLCSCCATIRMCCGSGRRYRDRGSAQFVLLPQHSGDKPRY